MELRKIQKTGGSSYILTLPKEWVLKHGLKERSTVGILSHDDGKLVIVPGGKDSEYQRDISIDVDAVHGQEFLYRLLIGTYMSGYTNVKIHSRTRLDPDSKATVKQFTQDAIGLEILEETNVSLIIKDLMDPSEVNFTSWIDRMSHVVIMQMEESILSMKCMDAPIIETIISRDKEINRINWLVHRKQDILARNILLIAHGNRTIMDFARVSRLIERIGDHVVQVATGLVQLSGKNVPEGIIDSLAKAMKRTMALFQAVVGSCLASSTTIEANQNIDQITSLVDTCKEMERGIISSESIAGIALGTMIESTRRILEYCIDISELVINHLINTKLQDT